MTKRIAGWTFRSALTRGRSTLRCNSGKQAPFSLPLAEALTGNRIVSCTVGEPS